MAKREGNAVPEARTEGPVIVALGFDGSGPDLVRAGSALARYEGVDFECVTIDTGAERSPGEGVAMAEAQRLARSLGSRISSEPGLGVAAGLLDCARRLGARTIVVGAGGRRRLTRSLADRLRAEGRELRIVAIAAPGPASLAPEARAGLSPRLAWQFLAAFLAIAVVTALNFLLVGYAGYWAAAIPYLAAISLSALALESGPVLLAALLSAVAWDFLFIPPRFTLHISKPEDAFMLGLYLIIAVFSGLMTGRLRANERLLAARETRMSRISSLAFALAGAKTIQAILDKGMSALQEAFGVEAIVVLQDGGGSLKRQAESGWEPLDESARDAARISFEEKKGTGRFTRIRADSEWHFVPMEGPLGCLGVIGIRAPRDRTWDEGLESLLRTMAATISIAAARELAA